MRLLDTRTGEFFWTADPDYVRYAILSHVWSKEHEDTLQDLERIHLEVRNERKDNPDLPADAALQRASPKVRNACAYALKEGFDYIWIDSCCIDKATSAELSEAINSMYAWYSKAIICYAFLHDVSSRSHLHQSEWFTRGWTLQELIAPRAVIFLSSQWEEIGDKVVLAGILERITGIDDAVLRHSRPLTSISVARRLSWASKRVTTRPEDKAYCLLGIFGVNMAPIYGEGDRAFIRLQEEILHRIPDQSIFAWNLHVPFPFRPHSQTFGQASLLALSPAWFSKSRDVSSISREELSARCHVTIPPSMYSVASYGLRSNFPIVSITTHLHLAFLACTIGPNLLAMILKGDLRGALVPIGIAAIDFDSVNPWAFISRFRPRFRPFPRYRRMHLYAAGSAHTTLTPSGVARLVDVYISRGPQDGLNRDVVPPLLLRFRSGVYKPRSESDYSLLHAIPLPSGFEVRDGDPTSQDTRHVITNEEYSFCQFRITSRSATLLDEQGYNVVQSIEPAVPHNHYLPSIHVFTFCLSRCKVAVYISPCVCSPVVKRRRGPENKDVPTVKFLALTLTANVIFPSMSCHSDTVAITLPGDAFDPDNNYIPISHDWEHPHHSGDGRRAISSSAFTTQEFSFVDKAGPRIHPFLQIRLDRLAPQGNRDSTTFDLSVLFNAEPRAPIFKPVRMPPRASGDILIVVGSPDGSVEGVYKVGPTVYTDQTDALGVLTLR